MREIFSSLSGNHIVKWLTNLCAEADDEATRPSQSQQLLKANFKPYYIDVISTLLWNTSNYSRTQT